MKTQIIFTKEPAMMKTKNSGEKIYRDDESCEYFYFSLFFIFYFKVFVFSPPRRLPQTRTAV